LEEVCKLYGNHIQTPDRKIVLENVPQLYLTTDSALLRRVVGNMVLNAMEATPSGGTVTVAVNSGREEVEVSVTNRGEMPRDVQLNMFKRSFSTKSPSDRGIGTYSMKLFGERYLGGKVDFRCVNGYTTFFIKLSLAEPDCVREVPMRVLEDTPTISPGTLKSTTSRGDCMSEFVMFNQEIERVALSIGIPPCPGILQELTEELKKADPDFSKVEKLLLRDVALSATLIKTINSPLYDLRTKIGSVSQAVDLLGLSRLTDAISNLVIKNVFAAKNDKVNMERYWDSSAKLALSTMHLAKRIPGLNKDDAYTYGLFQNCGVPILMQRFPDYKETLHKANNLSEGKFTAVEDDAHGTDHATVSYLMTKSWNLPEVTASAIQFHHEYDMLSDSQTKLHSDSKNLIALGLLADHAIHLSSGSNKNFSLEWTKGGALALAQLDLSYADFADICEDIAHLIE